LRPFGVIARPHGSVPTLMVLMTARVPRSMTLTVPSTALAT
jgi:hypothetical protein